MLNAKQTSVAAMLISFAFACQQPVEKKAKASLDADITGLKDSVVYISGLQDNAEKSDTVKVTNGKFHWEGNVTDPRKVYINTSERYMELFMENAPVQIKGTYDSLYYAKVTGSAAQDEFVAFDESLKDLNDPMYALFPKLHEAKDEQVKAALETRIDSFRTARRERTKDYIRKHPASAVSVALIEDMAVIGEFAPLDSLYKVLDATAQQTYTGKKLAQRLEVLKRSAIGQPIKDFTQNDKNGNPVKISSFKGKYILVDFWASWCGPCRAENPNVLLAYNKYKGKGFDVLGISLDDKEDKWKEAIEKDGMPWTQISDLKGYRNEIAEYYGIQAIPSTMLLDANGVIIAKDLRGTALHNKLAEILH
ncbi:AhpC/TSA family protein [Pseudoflavitalea sp. G-6-1-2]|uniref:TlpA disulfide reductase family protein n=1 Tax=Pseudoflavitalea sp. G-6-1-2 TaxID=2728841 RepID=UPI00146D80D5|nr:TlpA disulfide reductase family protein [Pseudoflavitalea sp. G-6-1-2]NML22310.1 AhpC/TSA family protein [Pseudoflavitalea sp. G-6-1-2]